MAHRVPEPAPGGYFENALVFFIDDDRDELILGERLDPATDLPTIDAIVPIPVEPDGGWGRGAVIVNGRPVRRISPVVDIGMSCIMAPLPPRVIVAHRRGSTRAPRSQSSRRSRAPSRDGPSDEGEGGGEEPPPPAANAVADEGSDRPSTNRHPTDVLCRGWSVAGHGIDTVAFGWYDADTVDAIRALASDGVIDASTGRRQRSDWNGSHMRLSIPVAGITIGVYPGRSLVTAEARAAAMLVGHDGDHALIAPERLPEVAEGAVAALASIGMQVVGPTLVRRLDLAGELWFAEPADGLAYLHACQRCLHLSRLAQRTWNAKGEARLQSIAWQTPSRNRTQLRMYDSGAKHGGSPIGQLLRVERERRWPSNRRQTPEQVLAGGLSRVFCGPMRSWLAGAPTAIVTTAPTAAITDLFDRVRRGELPRRTAEALIGNVVMLTSGGDLLSPLDRQRRARRVRRAGIALDVCGDPGAAIVDVRSPLVALAGLWGSA